jgi:hypothetical protein
MGALHFALHNDVDAVSFELAASLGGVDVERAYQLWQREGASPMR